MPTPRPPKYYSQREGLGAQPLGWGALPPQVVRGWGGGGPNPCVFASREGLGGGPTLVHLQVVEGWGSREGLGSPNPCPFASREGLGGPQPLSNWRPPCPIGGLGVGNLARAILSGLGLLIYTDTMAWRPSLATPQGCGRQALQPSRACHGLAAPTYPQKERGGGRV